ncbi:MAG TPA: YncE family protein [Croceibacterium sp.]|nr:YncE family protein [Croceibacterium sp.]
MRMMSATAIFAVLVACSGPVPAQEPAEPHGVLIVANKRGNSVSRIDLASGAETHRTPSCDNPHELAVSPDRRHVALACYSGESLELFETAGLRPVGRIALGQGARPHGLVWHSGGTIVASAEGRGSIFTVEAPLSESPVVKEIGSGAPGPHLVAVDSAGTTVWGTIVASGVVVRYDLSTGRETARSELGGRTEAIALSPDEKSLWVGANESGKVYRLNPDTLEVEAELDAGRMPIRLAVHPRGGRVVSSNMGDGGLSVIDTTTNEVIRSPRVSGEMGAGQVTLVFSADGARLYAAETMRDTVAEIDFESGAVLRRLPSGAGGDGLAVME